MLDKVKPVYTRQQVNTFVNRYQHLITVMRELPEHEAQEHVVMNDWVNETACGTTRCAAGWAGSSKWFRKQEFKLIKGASCSLLPYYRGHVNWSAIARFFGEYTSNGRRDIHHPVFGPMSYKAYVPFDNKPVKSTSSEVIEHIQREIEWLKSLHSV